MLLLKTERVELNAPHNTTKADSYFKTVKHCMMIKQMKKDCVSTI